MITWYTAKRAEEQAGTTAAGDDGEAESSDKANTIPAPASPTEVISDIPITSNGNASKSALKEDDEAPLLVVEASPPLSIESTAIQIEDQVNKLEEEVPVEVIAVSPTEIIKEEVIAFEGLPEEIEKGADQVFKENSAEAIQTTTRTDEDDADDANKNADGNDDEEQAALKIQAGFRGFQTRKILKENEAAAASSVKFADEEVVKSVGSPEIDPKEVESTAESVIAGVEEALADEIQAATKIQAGFRGFQTRKQLQRNSSRPGKYIT